MLAYVFRALNGSYGFTRDRKGSNLPAHLGPWLFLRHVEFNEITHGELGRYFADILGRKGFCISRSAMLLERKEDHDA